jgi:hypothetical protein
VEVHVTVEEDEMAEWYFLAITHTHDWVYLVTFYCVYYPWLFGARIGAHCLETYQASYLATNGGSSFGWFRSPALGDETEVSSHAE